MENFIIVLFKNKKKKKIIKGYITEKSANIKFNNLISNNNVEFPMLFENYEPCEYEIALLSKVDGYQMPLFKTDDMGRNVNIFVEGESEYVIKRISNYYIEELILDWRTNKKITFSELVNIYIPKKDLKTVSKLNNKIVIQCNEDFNIFTLKNEEDSERLLKTIESFFIKNGRNDCIFIRDLNTIHRKWLYDILEKNGFSRKKLYRKHTTFSKRI
jgi:hypothetical protein